MGKEQFLLKTINDVECVIAECKRRHWLTKTEWVENEIPMKQLVQEMLKAYKDYKEWQMRDIKKDVGTAKR